MANMRSWQSTGRTKLSTDIVKLVSTLVSGLSGNNWLRLSGTAEHFSKFGGRGAD